MRYRRANVQGGTYFFTVNLADRNSTALTDNVESLRSVLRSVKGDHNFDIHAMVVLPDHLHALWTLPAGDADYPKRWSLIKAGFSRSLSQVERIPPTRRAKRERGIWQRRYWEHQIRDSRDYENHVHYIHYNPVKHGYTKHPMDWPYSSVHRYCRRGLIPDSWTGECYENGSYRE